MRIEFDIKIFPWETHTYHLPAFTEGPIRIFTSSGKFLDADGILLVELAIFLHEWLENARNSPTDLYYRSMDFEEEPILAFSYSRDDDAFELTSVWSTHGKPERVPSGEVLQATKEYLQNLKVAILARSDIDLFEKLTENQRTKEWWQL